MSKYIKYKRIFEVLGPEQLQELFDSFIVDGWEIISYREDVLDTREDSMRIRVSILVGKINMGLGTKGLLI